MASKKEPQPVAESSATGIERTRNTLSKSMASPGAKFILIGFITLILLIPALIGLGID